MSSTLRGLAFFMETNIVEPGNIAAKEPQAEPEMARKPARKRNIIIFAIVCALNIALLIVIGTQLLTPASPGQGSVNSMAVTIGEVNTPLVGKPAPAFTL